MPPRRTARAPALGGLRADCAERRLGGEAVVAMIVL